MRSNAAWLGIAAMGVLQYMGPRPLFVRTAYAAEPTPIHEVHQVLVDTGEPLRIAGPQPELAPGLAHDNDAARINGLQPWN